MCRHEVGGYFSSSVCLQQFLPGDVHIMHARQAGCVCKSGIDLKIKLAGPLAISKFTVTKQ